MGQIVVIRAKDKTDKSLQALNKALKQIGVNGKFVTTRMMKRWYNNVLFDRGGDYSSLREGLKDKNGHVTFEAYVKFLKGVREEIGAFSFDYAFGRTSDDQLNKIAHFIYAHKDEIEPIRLDDAKEIISRGDAPNHIKEAMSEFVYIQKPRERLPKAERVYPDCQSGQLLCKSFSPKPFWVIFGRVDTPKFMKVKVYASDLSNNIYRDKKGLAYMLIPTMTLDGKKFGSLNRDEFFREMCLMGLREHPNFFFPFIYKFSFAKETTKALKEIAKQFSAHYTPEELQERFEIVNKQLTGDRGYYASNSIKQLDKILRLIPSVQKQLA